MSTSIKRGHQVLFSFLMVTDNETRRADNSVGLQTLYLGNIERL